MGATPQGRNASAAIGCSPPKSPAAGNQRALSQWDAHTQNSFRIWSVIIAGGFDGSGTSTIYHWKGGVAAPEPVLDATRPDLNPEAATILGNGRLLVLSDDGTEKIGGRDCKKLKNPDQRMFRAAVIDWQIGHLVGQASQSR